MNSWIPSRRIRAAVILAAILTAAGMAGAIRSPWALALLIPGLGAGFAAFVMLRIRSQLSARGGGFERRIHELALSRLPLYGGAAVLDVGCGDASLLVALLMQHPDAVATGVDYWGNGWDYAQAACEKRLADLGLSADFRRMDAARLAFPDASFDAVVSVMCFHEVRAGPLLAVGEALRVLKPGGAFVFIDRFGDRKDYGEPEALAAALRGATEVRSEAIVEALKVPWPLNSQRALGPVEVITGRKPTRPRAGEPR